MTSFDEPLLADGNVTVTATGPLLTVTLNDPERRNAQTPATWAALAHIGANLPGSVAVVVLRGAGQTFSAGMDRRMFTPEGVPGYPSLADIVADTDAVGADIIAGFQSAFACWREVDAITISAVQGYAVGAGFQLALATDLMVVADDVQLIMKESTFGLVPDLTGTHPLVAAVGYRRALEICLTARPVTAVEAVATGLAVQSVPVAELDTAIAALVAHLTGLAPGTAVATKRLLADASRRTPQQQQQAERESQMGRLRHLVAAFGR